MRIPFLANHLGTASFMPGGLLVECLNDGE
jgi:hypothetical protein